MNSHKQSIYLVGLIISVFYICIHTSMPPEFFEENVDFSTYLPQQQPMENQGPATTQPPSSPSTQPVEVTTPQWQEEEETEMTITGTYDRQNWYKNLRYFREARLLYEKIVGIIETINQSKMTFYDKQRTIADQLANFYIDYGFQSGEIDEQNNNLVEHIKTLREKQASLTEEERTIFVELNEKKKEIEQLKADLLLVHELEESLEQGYALLLKQIDISHSYQEKSLTHYEHISEAVNDEVAEKLYYEMQTFLENVTKIQQYIQQEFTGFVEQTSKLIATSQEKIKQRVELLKERGILLGKEVKKIDQEQKEVKKPVVKKPQTWMEKISYWFNTVGYYIVLPFKTIYEWLIPAEKTSKKIQPLREKSTTEIVSSSVVSLPEETEKEIKEEPKITLPITSEISSPQEQPIEPVVLPDERETFSEHSGVLELAPSFSVQKTEEVSETPLQVMPEMTSEITQEQHIQPLENSLNEPIPF